MINANDATSEGDKNNNTFVVQKWTLPLCSERTGFREINKMSRAFFAPVERLAELKDFPFGTKCLGRSKPCYRAAVYVLHCCHIARYTTDDGYCSLSSKKMALRCGNAARWKRLWSLLEKAGVVECDHISKIGSKSFSFRLTPQWEGCQWRQLEHFDNWRVFSDDREQIPGLELDRQAALETLERVYRMRKVIGAVGGHQRGVRAKRWNHERFDVFAHRVESFDSRFSVARDTTGGRLFTAGNMLPKELRAHLTFFGEETAELDVKNCQPLLLSTLYETDCPERVAYVTLAESGKLYEIAGATVAPGMERNEFKDYFICWLFGQGKRMNYLKPKIAAWFTAKFPILAGIIGDYMKRGTEALPRELQRRESTAIWRAVNKEGILHMSVHDGVRVALRDLERARAVLMDSFWNLYRLKPKIIVSDVQEDLREFEAEEKRKSA